VQGSGFRVQPAALHPAQRTRSLLADAPSG